MIPQSDTNPATLANLVAYLREQIFRAQGERQELERRWRIFDTMYKAIPEEEYKTFPFEGAANLVIPVIATDVDTIFSRIMGIMFAPENFWSCRPLNDTMVDFAPKLEDFLKWAQEHELGVYDAVADWSLELVKLGTAVVKQRYKREMKQIYQFRETDFGTIEQQFKMLIKDSPSIDHVSLYDFYVPAGARNLKEASWCAERINLTWGQLMQRVEAGVYTLPVGVGQWWAYSRGSQNEQNKQAMDLYVPGIGDKFELMEFWLDYDIAGRGPQAIVATLHIPSQSLLRVDYNPFFNQEKPYSYARYLRQEKRFYGIGLAEMLGSFQDEVSTMHNQRLDNATLANATMMKGKRGIGLKDNEPIIPGRWFLVDNMDDVQTLQMGQKYDSTVPYEELTMSYATKRSGVNDYVAGNPTAATGYAPAATSIALIQEGAKRFDQVMREIRNCWGEVGVKIVELYQQYNQRGKEYLVEGQHDGAMVHQILQFPLELIRNGVAIEITASSASMNKDVEIRTNTIIMQMVIQYYQQLMQALQVVSNPQLPPLMRQAAAEMVMGGTTLMKQILDSYGRKDTDKIIPDLLGGINNAQQQLSSGFGAQPGGQGVPPGSPGAPGMAALPAGPQGAPAAGNPTLPGQFGGGGLPAPR